MELQEPAPKAKRPTRSRAKPAANKPVKRRPKKGTAELLPAVVDTGTDAPAALVEAAPSPAQTPFQSVGRPWGVRLGMVRREATAGPLGPRRILVRDASGVLMVLALLVLLASQIPATPASGGESPSDPGAGASGGIQIPRGTLNLISATPVQSLAPGETPRPTFDIGHATLPPWCANPTCTVFVTPSPSPTPTPKPTAQPTTAPPSCATPDPLATPLATPCPTPTPVPTATPSPSPSPSPTPIPQVAVPGFSCGTTGGEYAATLASVNLNPGGHYTATDMVLSVSPAPGTMVNEGSSVKIVTDSSATPCP